MYIDYLLNYSPLEIVINYAYIAVEYVIDFFIIYVKYCM